MPTPSRSAVPWGRARSRPPAHSRGPVATTDLPATGGPCRTGHSGCGTRGGRGRRTGGAAGDTATAAAPDPIEVLAGDLEYDVERIFRFVADEVRYEPYDGILRGARGALAGRAATRSTRRSSSPRSSTRPAYPCASSTPRSTRRPPGRCWRRPPFPRAWPAMAPWPCCADRAGQRRAGRPTSTRPHPTPRCAPQRAASRRSPPRSRPPQGRSWMHRSRCSVRPSRALG